VGLAYLSAARGVGFLGGPILGQIFVNNLGYWQSFVIFSVCLLITVVISYFVLPASLNVDNSKTALVIRKTEQLKQAQAQVTYGEIFRIPRAQFALFTVMIAMIFSLFMSTYISQYIQEIVGIP
jgi:MFS family permease